MIERINLLQELSTESFGNHNGFLQLTTHVPCGLIPCPGEIGGNPRSFDEVDTPGVSHVLDEWAGQDGYRDDALDPGLDSLLDQNLVPLDPLDFWRQRTRYLRNFNGDPSSIRVEVFLSCYLTRKYIFD